MESFFLLLISKKKADDRTRTDNLLITSQLLCQLSHIGVTRAEYKKYIIILSTFRQVFFIKILYFQKKMRQGAQNIQKIGFHEPQNHRKAGDIAPQFNGLLHKAALPFGCHCLQNRLHAEDEKQLSCQNRKSFHLRHPLKNSSDYLMNFPLFKCRIWAHNIE